MLNRSHSMRRLIANSLLLVMLGIFFAPAIVASVPQPVPICCRRGGAHHCAMTAEMMVSTDGTAFRCNNPCPMRQGSQLGSSLIALPVSRSAYLELHRQALIVGDVSLRHVELIQTAHSRGPPPESL